MCQLLFNVGLWKGSWKKDAKMKSLFNRNQLKLQIKKDVKLFKSQ